MAPNLSERAPARPAKKRVCKPALNCIIDPAQPNVKCGAEKGTRRLRLASFTELEALA